MFRSILVIFFLFFSVAAKAADNPIVILETEFGDIHIELYVDAAPLSAGDFLRYASEGLFNGEGFYRTVKPSNDQGVPKINVLQGGIISEQAVHPMVPHEGTASTGIKNTQGTIALARDAVGTGSAAYFFINMTDNPGLDEGGTRNPDLAGYAAFGMVVRGMDVAQRIHQLDDRPLLGENYLAGQMLTPPVVIHRVHIKTSD